MGNAGMGSESLGQIRLLLFDALLQLGDSANLLVRQDGVFPVAVDRQASGIVATVFQARQS